VTIVNVQLWISIHVCGMKNWKHVSILLTLERVEAAATLNNIKGVILDAMGGYGGLLDEAMASKWICLKCDSDSMFQGIWFGGITQTREQIALYLIGVHCVAY